MLRYMKLKFLLLTQKLYQKLTDWKAASEVSTEDAQVRSQLFES